MQLQYGYPSNLPVSPQAEALPLIRVSGEGRVEAPPDILVVSLGFSDRAPQATAAYQQTASGLNRIVRTLNEIGIRQEQMQTDQISLHPIYEKDQLTGYEGTATVRITLHDLSVGGAVIDRAAQAGANIVNGISFEVREVGPFEAAALALAVQDAGGQAAVFARSLGIGLGAVWRVQTEPGISPIIPAMVRTANRQAAASRGQAAAHREQAAAHWGQAGDLAKRQ